MLIAKAIKHQPSLKISELCQVANIHRSLFYYWKEHEYDRAHKDESVLSLVKVVHEKSQAKAGIRTTVMKIKRQFGLIVNPKKVARLKREYGLFTKIRRKRKFNGHIFKQVEHAVKKNILARNFSPSGADQVYSTDITELRFGKSQKAYLSAVKDLCTKEILAYSTSTFPGMGLSLDVAKKCLKKLSPAKRKKLIIHSDQGVHYTNFAFRSILENASVQQSMSRKGNCLDNAPIESFFGHLKDELDLSVYETYDEVKEAVRSYISYYNKRRPQWGLKAKTPAEHRGFIEGPLLFNLS